MGVDIDRLLALTRLQAGLLGAVPLGGARPARATASARSHPEACILPFESSQLLERLVTLTSDGLPDVWSLCGYCANALIYPGYWIEQRPYASEDDPLVPAGVYFCLECHRPSIVIFDRRATDDEPAPTVRTVRPVRAPASLGIELFKGTTVEKYRDEAWACYLARHYRAAIVVARSALQALARRYIAMGAWSAGGFGGEIAQLSAIAGTGWEAIGIDIRDFGNQWAHPDPSQPREPKKEHAHAALDRLDSVIRFVSDQERFGKITPINTN